MSFTLLAVLIFRLGQTLPLPYVRAGLTAAERDHQLWWVLDLLTGGGLFRLSVFTFGVFPCLATRILLRVLTGVIPRLAALRQEGAEGARRFTRYTRWLTVGVGTVAATVVVTVVARRGTGQGVPDDDGVFPLVVMVACMVAGTAVVLRLAELMTDRGIGDGVRILLLAQIAAVVPAELGRAHRAEGAAVFAVAGVVGLVMVVGTVVVAQAQRRVPVEYAKRMLGRRMYGGTATYVPLRVNQSAGPAILAAMLLYVPVPAAQVWPGSEWLAALQARLHDEGDPVRMSVYFVLVVFFAWFRAAGSFSPEGQANDMARSGAFVPGIRPGRPTAEYFAFVHNRIIAAGSLYLGVLALLPVAGLAVLGLSPRFPFAGAVCLLIALFVVDVALTTVRQTESLRTQRHYEGFLR